MDRDEAIMIDCSIGSAASARRGQLRQGTGLSLIGGRRRVA
jgi:hypothetical protein